MTKESKLTLGSWLAFWEANNMCTFIAEYEILTYNKQKSNACKLQFFFKITCKKDDFPKARSRMLMKPFKSKI